MQQRVDKQGQSIIASSRSSVSQGAAQKTAHEKIKKPWREFSRFLSPRFFIFLRAVYCAAPWLTERLKEAKSIIKAY